MYGILLIVFKVFSDALTAISGGFGLLTEFKDPATKRITVAGKAALAGIVVGFILSCTMTILEHVQSAEEERKHEAEITRLLHPVGHMTAALFVPVSKELGTKSPYMQRIEGAFSSAAANPDERHGSDYDGISLIRNGGQLVEVLGIQNQLRQKYGDGPNEIFTGTTPPLDVFKDINCGQLAQINGHRRADWNLWSYPHDPDPNKDDGIAWDYKSNDSLTLQRLLDVKIQQSTGAITSVEDLPGSSLFIEWRSQYPFESFTFSPAEGISYSANRMNTQNMTIEVIVGEVSSGDQTGYCYNFPKSNLGH